MSVPTPLRDPARDPSPDPSPDACLRPGARNLITDVAGLRVGNACDEHLKSGTTVLCADEPFVAAVDVMGGAPGTRETDCLAPDALVDRVDALVLSGGSAFGLSAASGVCDALRAHGRGYPVGPVRVPIVPAAILFDLLAGGVHDWRDNPWTALGRRAYANAAAQFELGCAGAGTGATTAHLKGGLGSASLLLPDGHTVGALVAANPNGDAVDPHSGRFHAWSCEFGDEFGGLGAPPSADPGRLPVNHKLAAYRALRGEPVGADTGGGPAPLPGGNTTLAIVATDHPLDKAGCRRLAVAAQDGMARALQPSHTPIDGDIVFALSTSTGSTTPTGGGGAPGQPPDIAARLLLGHAASVCVARAIARAVFEASTRERDTLPTWRARHANARRG